MDRSPYDLLGSEIQRTDSTPIPQLINSLCKSRDDVVRKYRRIAYIKDSDCFRNLLVIMITIFSFNSIHHPFLVL